LGRSGGACLRTAGGSLGVSTCKGCGSTSSEVAPPRSTAHEPKRFSPKQKRGVRVVMSIDPNRLWGRSNASADALLPLQLATAPPHLPSRQRRPSFVLCFSCPARLRRRQEGGSQGQPSPQPPRPSRPRQAKAAAKPKKSAATAKPKKTAAAAAGTKRKAPEKKVVAKPKKSPVAKPPAWSRISRAASVMVIHGEISAHTFPLHAKYVFF